MEEEEDRPSQAKKPKTETGVGRGEADEFVAGQERGHLGERQVHAHHEEQRPVRGDNPSGEGENSLRGTRRVHPRRGPGHGVFGVVGDRRMEEGNEQGEVQLLSFSHQHQRAPWRLFVRRRTGLLLANNVGEEVLGEERRLSVA